ncbi:hypothetical protein M407DRAFT_51549, partial [Tulasnella calospora MUT 4182]
ANPDHPEFKHCYQLLDVFKGTSIHCKHIFLVTEALGIDLHRYRERFKRWMLPAPAAKRVTKQTLLASDYLHRKCSILYT